MEELISENEGMVRVLAVSCFLVFDVSMSQSLGPLTATVLLVDQIHKTIIDAW